jgi:hypothetical protein
VAATVEPYEFIHDLASCLKNRIQLTSDRHRPYLEAVELRYSPPVCIGTIPQPVTGRPDPNHISTSFVERQNWTVRTTMHRYIRLSNGFSRKIENHKSAVALNYFAYNFIKIHSTLRVTPAMAAGVTSKLWDVADLVDLLIEAESKKAAQVAGPAVLRLSYWRRFGSRSDSSPN